MHTVFIDSSRVKRMTAETINQMIFDGISITHAKNCEACK